MLPIILIGPSGVGKSTLARYLAKLPDTEIIQTITTRPQRVGVIDEDRIFVSETTFDELEAKGTFQFVVPYAGHRYGFPAPTTHASILVLIYKVAGLALLGGRYKGRKIIALEAPLQVLKERLADRATPERFQKEELREEIAAGRKVADLIINTTAPLNECTRQITSFIDQSR